MAIITPKIIAGIRKIVASPIPRGTSIISTTNPIKDPRTVNNIFKNITPALRAAAMNIKNTIIPIKISISVSYKYLFVNILHRNN